MARKPNVSDVICSEGSLECMCGTNNLTAKGSIYETSGKWGFVGRITSGLEKAIARSVLIEIKGDMGIMNLK